MIELKGEDGKIFNIEFRHRRRTGKFPELHAKAPINAVTQCVLYGIDGDGKTRIVQGSAICLLTDQFSRPTGRLMSFYDAFGRMQGAFMLKHANAIRASYTERFAHDIFEERSRKRPAALLELEQPRRPTPEERAQRAELERANHPDWREKRRTRKRLARERRELLWNLRRAEQAASAGGPLEVALAVETLLKGIHGGSAGGMM